MDLETFKLALEVIRTLSLLGLNWLTIYFTTTVAIERCVADKLYNQKGLLKLTRPELKQKYDDIEINKISNAEFKKTVLEFTKVLLTHFPDEALTNFYNNINELSIKNNKSISAIGIRGSYNGIKNSIAIADKTSIYHELFHMASRSYNKEDKLMYVGFCQQGTDTKRTLVGKLGSGLNEGYTEVLTHRYFGDNHELCSSYPFETSIAKKLEIIIGEDKMTLLYLKGDMLGIVGELKHYASEEEIMKFITRLDLIYNFNPMYKSILIRESIFDTYEFLLKAYAVKIKKFYDKGIINIDGFNFLSIEYLKLFDNYVVAHSKGYFLSNVAEMYDIILNDIGAPVYAPKHVKKSI